jgi:hypothetical protein
MVLWYLTQAVSLGPTVFAEHIHELSAEAGASSWVGPFSRSTGALYELLASGFGPWCIAGLVYAWLKAVRDPSFRQPAQVLLLVFASAWLGLYLIVTMGWSRYAVPGAAVSALFAAVLIRDLGRRFTILGRPGSLRSPRAWLADPVGAALLTVLALTLLGGIAFNVVTVGRDRDASPQQLAAVINRDVKPDAVVESSEWEIDFLTDRQYHHPPAEVVFDANRVLLLGHQPRALRSYRVPATSTYLIDGRFSKWWGIYRTEIDQGRFKRIASIGEYDLYRAEAGR